MRHSHDKGAACNKPVAKANGQVFSKDRLVPLARPGVGLETQKSNYFFSYLDS